MDLAGKTLRGIRVQDAVWVVLCALLIYVLRIQPSLKITPEWHSHLERNKGDSQTGGVTPVPIVTDMDSDGITEVVMVTKDGRLKTLRVPTEDEKRSGAGQLPELTVVNETQLPIATEEGGLRSYPVVMETGYITEYLSMVQMRKQVVVVVLDDWRVLCYDNTLNLMWSEQLIDLGQGRENYKVKAMTLLISPQVIGAGDQGSIIIGGSFTHLSHDASAKRKTKETKVHVAWAQGSRARREAPLADDEDTTDGATHFSTFALSGNNGTVRWHHLPADFKAEQRPEAPVEAHHWKLALKKNVAHVGEQPWTKFSAQILQQLPHSWHELSDTRMELLKLRKQEVTSPPPEGGRGLPVMASHPAEPEPTVVAELFGEHLQGYAYGGMRPHSHHEHITNPDTVLIYNHRGLEALSLRTGQPLTTVRLYETFTYVDLLQTGHLSTIRTEDEACSVEVDLGGVKAIESYQMTLNTAASWWDSLSMTSRNRWASPESETLAAPPVVVPSVAARPGLLSHVMGATLASRKRGYDHVYLTTGSRMTSLDAKGNVNWQTFIPLVQITGMDHLSPPTTGGGKYHMNMRAFSPQVYGKKTAVAVVGFEGIVLVDLVTGRTLAEHSLPCRSTRHLVVEDFNNDGWNDVIVTCSNGYVGFSITKDVNFTQTAMVSACVVLALLVLTWCFRPSQIDESEILLDR